MKIRNLLISFFLLFAISGCVADDEVINELEKLNASSVKLDVASLSLTVGDSRTLKVTFLPQTARHTAVTWSSSNSAVAQVFSEGLVKAISAGNCTVTVTSKNGKTASCQVVVSQPVSSVSLDKTSLSLEVGDKMQLNATITPSNASDTQLEWSTTSSAVAQVSKSGLVTAVGAGNCTVTVTSNNGKSAYCQVVVSQPVVVDMGLSVKWATCNLGATKPEDYGGYYQWAGTSDVSARIGYVTGHNYCPYHSGSSYSSGWTKYVPSAKSSYWSGTGNPDDKTTLDPEDDVAHVVLGGKWRMPTKAEWEELSSSSNCTWTWTSLNGVNGYKVQSKKSGYTDKWIFLPAAGYRVYDMFFGLNYADYDGYYRSSSLYADKPDYAYCLYFYWDRVNANYWGCGRYDGLPVRPVSE